MNSNDPAQQKLLRIMEMDHYSQQSAVAASKVAKEYSNEARSRNIIK